MKKLGLVAALIVLLTGCRSVSVLSFDIWRPAKVTFPTEITRVTVVNNSADPSEKEGNIYTDLNNKQYALMVAHDSTSYRLAEQIAIALSQARYFPEITIFYDDSIALPKALYPNLTETQLNVIREHTNYTAVVSLDKTDMTVAMTDDVINDSMGENLFVSQLAVATNLALRVYWPHRQEPTTEWVTDTLYWQSYGYTPDEAHASLPTPHEFQQVAMESISVRVRRLFIPYLDKVERYIYTSINPALSDGYDFWQNKQYKEASYLWEYVYEEEKSLSARAMAAANLAVYHELNDNYGAAIDWIDKSISLLKQKPNQYLDDFASLQEYRRQLIARQKDKSTLQKQV